MVAVSRVSGPYDGSGSDPWLRAARDVRPRRAAAAAATVSESEKRRAFANGGGGRNLRHPVISVERGLPRPARPPL